MLKGRAERLVARRTRVEPDSAKLEDCVHLHSIADPDSEVTWNKVRRWLQHCKQQHRSCDIGMSGYVYRRCNDEGFEEYADFPSRIIDVGSMEAPQVKLAEQRHQAQYAILSYCWGPNPSIAEHGYQEWPHLTTRKNLAARLRGEEIILPQTLQDACTVARKLKIPWIWIDSICIVQDDRSDWATEAKKMTQYYQGAVLTIACSASSRVDQGFLMPRPVAESVLLPFVYRGRNLGTVELSLPSNLPDANEVFDSAWNSRAWTYQEWLLSRRILYFGNSQLLWEC